MRALEEGDGSVSGSSPCSDISQPASQDGMRRHKSTHSILRCWLECVDLCLKEENGRCLFAQPVQSLPAGVLAKLDERLQKMEKLVIGALIKLES